MKGIAQEQLLALEEAVLNDPAAACFPALAEAHRRAGRLTEAEFVARTGLEAKPDDADGRLVLASVLLDQHRPEDARGELEKLTAQVLASHGVTPPGEPAPDDADEISDAELDDAFGRAETDTAELIDPNRVAAATVAHVEAIPEPAAPEPAERDVPEAGPDALEPGSAFATATMAELLERQGDETGAERIRRALGAGASATPSAIPPAPAPERDPEPDPRREAIDTLERWLANLRGDRS